MGKKQFKQVLETSKQLVYPSEAPAQLGSTTLFRFKIPKLASLWSGRSSCAVFKFTCGTNTGIITASSMLSCLQRASLLIGGQNVINIEEAGVYLNHKIRCMHSASEINDLGRYVYGVNDQQILLENFPANYNQVSTSDFWLRLSPSLQIFTTAGDVASFELQVPLALVFDLLNFDLPMYLMGANDCVLEFVIDTSVGASLMTTTALPTSLSVSSSSYVFAVFHQMGVADLPPAVAIDYTDVVYTSQAFSAQSVANMSWALANQKAKRMFVCAQASGSNDAVLGSYYSSFVDGANNPLSVQFRYNDIQLWTEPLPMDGASYQYISDCSKHSFISPVGRYSFQDGAYLTNLQISAEVTSTARSTAGKYNVLGVNFGKAPVDSILYDMSDDMRTQVIDTTPVILQIRSQVAGQTITKVFLVHCEVQKKLSLGMGGSSIMVA